LGNAFNPFCLLCVVKGYNISEQKRIFDIVDFEVSVIAGML